MVVTYKPAKGSSQVNTALDSLQDDIRREGLKSSHCAKEAHTMFDHMQVSQLVSSLPVESLFEPTTLSTLLACSDFRDGLEFGQRIFQEEYEDDPDQVPQTEEALVFFVDWELSAQMYRREKDLDRHFKTLPLSYVHHIGFVMGYLNQLMATRQLSYPVH
jgi:hypothetical protein